MKKALLIVALATTCLAVQPAAAALSLDNAPGLVVAAASLQSQPSAPSQPDASIDVTVEKDTHAWYANPMWLAIGGVALLLLIVLIVMAARGGGGATVVSSK